MFLALQHTTVPEQFGVVLVIEPGGRFDPEAAARLLATRVRAVPRLRQRILRVPPGCGRPVWVDDADFAVDRHVDVVACPPPGDEPAMLAAATELLLRPLPLDRPLWAARFVTGLAGGRVALVVVVQHALADGLGGLAVLGALLDGAPAAAGSRSFPVPRPDAQRARRATRSGSRARALARIPAAAAPRAARARERARAAERIGRAAPCSLLQPTGPRRRVAVGQRRPRARSGRPRTHRGATVNDALVSAIAGALHACLEGRGEDPPPLVIAVPVAVRRGTTAADPGNAFTETRARGPGRR